MDTPLASWRHDGRLRTYQAEVLERIPAGTDEPEMHIVAPPGSGKTLLGLLLAAREGRRTLVLAPTVTIRQQWVQTARSLAPADEAVSDDPARLAELTVLTYQLLSVTGDSAPFDDLARAQWVDELTAAGRREADAALWLAELSVDNPQQYRRGIRRRASGIRKRFVRERPETLARVLHPNAVDLIDRIVAAGIDTVVLDECHHLLDHWAIVVAYLTARIRAQGGRGLLIGLTATLPSPDDGTEYENYSQLLGEVDYEVPTPAVVREGHLTPYRDHVWFTEPALQEARFIRGHQQALADLVLQLLSSADGVAYLAEQLQPPGEDAPADAGDDSGRVHALERALNADFPLARACGAVLRTVAPGHPLVEVLPEETFGRPTTEELLTVLARFALSRLLPDPGAQRQWLYVRGALADFGLHLTDRGIRRGRNPIETTIAGSVAKDHAAVEIIRHELTGADGDRVRAVVVTDVVEAGNHRGLTGDAAPGALRVFELLCSDPVTAPLTPVLLTGRHLRVPAGAATTIAAALGAALGTPVEIAEGHGFFRELRTRGAGGGRLVAAVSSLVTEGAVRVLVGTRGLLGEGWDCPAVNTLIDLTSVATSAGSQQLRGRTLRLDPAWPEKVAHNWSVTCLIPPQVALDDAAEIGRLRRRHSHLWGLSADDDTRIITGLGHALDRPALALLDRVLNKDETASIAELRAAALATVRERRQTRESWRIGSPPPELSGEVVSIRAPRRTTLRRSVPALGGTGRRFALSSLTALASAVALNVLSGWHVPLGVVAIAAAAVGGGVVAGRIVPRAWRASRRRRDPAATYRAAASVIAETLACAGRIAPLPEEAIGVVSQEHPDGSLTFSLTIDGTRAQRHAVADALEELFGPVRTPRFLLRVEPTAPEPRAARPAPRKRAETAGAHRPGAVHLPVPQRIARRRGDADLFAALWGERVSGCALIELRGGAGLDLLHAVRAQPAQLDPVAGRTTLWG